MRPFKNIRKDKGYCCWYDDGPYNKWKKREATHYRKIDRRQAKQEVDDQLKLSIYGGYYPSMHSHDYID